MLYAIEDASITHLYKSGKEIYFSTGADASLYKASLTYNKAGQYLSQVFDLNQFATWGRVNLKATGDKTGVTIFTRTGDSSKPGDNWSEWKKCENSRIKKPARTFYSI